MRPAPISAGHALAHVAPDFLDSLSPAERFVLPHMLDVWLRPNQYIPRTPWRYYTMVCGRGFGKTLAIVYEINRRVMCGEAHSIMLVGPTEDKVEQVQIQNLIDYAPPWFKPERYNGGLRWPNGAAAVVFSSVGSAERPRGEDVDTSWFTEIVDWQADRRKKLFDNATTATRVGVPGLHANGQVFIDTTSSGKNETILHLQELHEQDPERYPMRRGTMFDNTMFSEGYLRDEMTKYPPGRARDEEVFGKIFAESAGALWKQAWIDATRVYDPPVDVEHRIIAVDPALSTSSHADETGICIGERDADEEIFIVEDLSGRHEPEAWADIVVRDCVENGAAGCVLERNRGGDPMIAVIRARAREYERAHGRSLIVREIKDPEKPIPPRTPGVIYVRQVTAHDTKSTRATGPAAYYAAGHVHHVGVLEQLELEQTTFEPGTRRSPNRYDAAVYAVLELSGLDRPGAPKIRPNMAGAIAEASRGRGRRAEAVSGAGGLIISGRRRIGL